jgi:hypothetical protein
VSDVVDLPNSQYKGLIYDALTLELVNMFDYESLEDFREKVRRFIQTDRRNFREWLEETLNHNHDGWSFTAYISWRDVPMKVHKFKQCVNCGRVFYDISRNGRAITCRYIPYIRFDRRTGTYKQSFHKDGRPKSACEMEWEARQERRRVNRKLGIDSDEKRGIPASNRYKVPRRRKTIYGIPIDHDVTVYNLYDLTPEQAKQLGLDRYLS